MPSLQCPHGIHGTASRAFALTMVVPLLQLAGEQLTPRPLKDIDFEE